MLDIIDVGRLMEPTIEKDAINRLVMDEVNKGVIKAIARTYTDNMANSRFKADFIHGKGEGQILLLHGPPGTGKTLTAGM
jgi:SpoVK/Ycf46/Vps4 family AAA+-type ATPase